MRRGIAPCVHLLLLLQLHLLLLLQLHKAVTQARPAHVPRRSGSTVFFATGHPSGVGASCCSACLGNTLTQEAYRSAATPVAATITHAAVIGAVAYAAAPVTHAEVTDGCATCRRVTPAHEMVPRAKPRIHQSTTRRAWPVQRPTSEKEEFCHGLQCDDRSGAGGKAGRGVAAAHHRVRRHRHGSRRDHRRGRHRGTRRRGQRYGTRHVVTSAAADAVASSGAAISVAVTVTRAVVTRHTPL